MRKFALIAAATLLSAGAAHAGASPAVTIVTSPVVSTFSLSTSGGGAFPVVVSFSGGQLVFTLRR